MFKRILVALDGAETSYYALDQALAIARHDQCDLTALCVVDARLLNEGQAYLPVDDEIHVSGEVVLPARVELTYETWAQELIAKACERGESAGVEIQTEVATGIPYQEIAARGPQYDLLVIGPWRLSQEYPGPFLAGNTIEQIVEHTHLPILSVQGPIWSIQRILVMFDDSPQALDALQLAATWSQAWELQLIVLAVQAGEDRAQELLHKAQARIQPVRPMLVARDGDPRVAILTAADDYDCDLIAVGVEAGHAWLKHPVVRNLEAFLEVSTLPVLLSH